MIAQRPMRLFALLCLTALPACEVPDKGPFDLAPAPIPGSHGAAQQPEHHLKAGASAVGDQGAGAGAGSASTGGAGPSTDNWPGTGGAGPSTGIPSGGPDTSIPTGEPSTPGDSTSTPGTGTGTETAPDAVDPACKDLPGTDPCIMCLKKDCCSVITTCKKDKACDCTLNCLTTQPDDLLGCALKNGCGIPDLSIFAELSSCSTDCVASGKCELPEGLPG